MTQESKRQTVEATPETVTWGAFDPFAEPVHTVSSGDTVEIQTVTTPLDDHVEFLTSEGFDRADVLEDELAVAEEVPHDGPGPHVVTGPVAIADAEPGDVLEVRIRELELRAPYGFNLFLPEGGALPKEFPYADRHVVPFDLENGTAQFSSEVEIPLDPFFGIMALSPDPSAGATNTAPPGYFGGNLDLKQLGEGSTLYLPVNAEEGLFWTGDGHAVQGNGEVCLTAAETSITGTFQFVLHETESRLEWPVAETDTHYVVMGIDPDLDEALADAVRASISLLVGQEGLTPAEAYRLSSLAVDFNVTQVVNGNKGVHGLIPKSIFAEESGIDPARLGAAQ
jgi:acetamidase/formamidase